MGLHEDGRRTVSYSEISSYQRCTYQHYLSYVKGYKRVRKEIGASATGTIVHLAIAAALHWYHANDYRHDDDAIFTEILKAVKVWSETNRPEDPIIVDEDGLLVDFSEAADEWARAVDEAAVIAYRTIRHLDVPNRWRTVVDKDGVPYIEYRLEHPMLPESEYVGVIDWVAVDLSKNITYVVDWKTRKTFQDDENSVIGGEDFNVQLSLYQYALMERGVNASGAIIYQISSRIPEIPDLTKKGAVSKAKIKTDWETYSEAVRSYGLDPNDYLDMKDQLDAVEFWRPVTHYRGKEELLNRWINARRWAEIIERNSDPAYVPPKVENVTCVFCPFARICLAEDKGWDVDYLIEDQYTKRVSQ